MTSSRIHSIYQREIQDLPLHNKQTILLVHTRKMFCENPDCQATTFAERHPFVAKYGKKTDRLVTNILNTSLQLSSISASRLLKTESVKVCKSSICTLLKKIPSIADNKSKDESSTYASAIAGSHPYAIQISDRFHLIKGLTEAVTKYIIREFPSRVEIPSVTVLTPEMQALYDTSNRAQRIKYAHQKRKEGFTISEIALLLHSGTTTINKYLSISENEIPEDRRISRERQHLLAIEQKQKEVDETRELYREGYTVEEIGRIMHHIPQTVKNI